MSKLLYAILIASISFSCYSQSNWELAKEENDIRIFVRPKEGSSIKEYKAVTNINTSLTNLVHKLTNGNALKNWNYKTSESKLLTKESDSVYIVYMYNDFPWPVKNRDHISKLKVITLNENTIKIEITSEANRVPKKEGIIRVRKFSGFWLLEKTENTIKVTQQMHGEPGGYLPSFLINSTLIKAPYYTLEKLKNQLEK